MNFCLWITGLPGSGKSTIVTELEQLFTEAGIDFITLNLDHMRTFLTPEPKYTEEEREIVYRCLVLTAQITVDHSTKNVIIDATGNRRAYRNLARQRISAFAEIYVKCPLKLCQSREAARDAGTVERNLYGKAKAGKLEGDLPGISVPYEEPRNPEILLRSDRLDPLESATIIMDYVKSHWMSQKSRIRT